MKRTVKGITLALLTLILPNLGWGLPVAKWTDFTNLTNGDYTLTNGTGNEPGEGGSITIANNGLRYDFRSGETGDGMYNGGAFSVEMDVTIPETLTVNAALVSIRFDDDVKNRAEVWTHPTEKKLQTYWWNGNNNGYGHLDYRNNGSWEPTGRKKITVTYNGPSKLGTHIYVDGELVFADTGLYASTSPLKSLTLGANYNGTDSANPATDMIVHSVKLYNFKMTALGFEEDELSSTAWRARFDGNVTTEGWITGWDGEAGASSVDTLTGKGYKITSSCHPHTTGSTTIPSPFSIALYANVSEITNTNAVLIAVGKKADHLALVKTETGKIAVCRAGSVVGELEVEPAELETAGSYHLIAFGSNGTSTFLYVNGQTKTFNHDSTVTWGTALQVGSIHGGVAPYSMGVNAIIDEARGYNKVLEEADLAVLSEAYPKRIPAVQATVSGASRYFMTIKEAVAAGATSLTVIRDTTLETACSGYNNLITVAEGVTLELATPTFADNNTKTFGDDATVMVNNDATVKLTSGGGFFNISGDGKVEAATPENEPANLFIYGMGSNGKTIKTAIEVPEDMKLCLRAFANHIPLSGGDLTVNGKIVKDAGDVMPQIELASGKMLSGSGEIAVGLTTNADTTFDGILSGDGALTVKAGTLTLTAANTRTGYVTIEKGATLDVSNASARLFNASDHLHLTGNRLVVRGTLKTREWNYGASLGNLGHNTSYFTINGGTIEFTADSSSERGYTIGAEGATFILPKGKSYTKSNPGNSNFGILNSGTLNLTGEGSYSFGTGTVPGKVAVASGTTLAQGSFTNLTLADGAILDATADTKLTVTGSVTLPDNGMVYVRATALPTTSTSVTILNGTTTESCKAVLMTANGSGCVATLSTPKNGTTIVATLSEEDLTTGHGLTVGAADAAVTSWSEYADGKYINIDAAGSLTITFTEPGQTFTFDNEAALTFASITVKGEAGTIVSAANAGTITANSTEVNTTVDVSGAKVALGAVTIAEGETLTAGANTALTDLADSGNLCFDATAGSITIDSDTRDIIRDLDTVFITFKGTDTNGVTMNYLDGVDSVGYEFGPRIKVESGRHNFGYGRETTGRFATGDSIQNPTIEVASGATLNFEIRDLSGWQGESEGDAVLLIREGGALNFKQHGSNTAYFRDRICIEGSTDAANPTIVTIENSDQKFVPYGGTDESTAQFTVAASEDAPTYAKITAVNAIKTDKPNGATGGFAVSVGANATLTFDVATTAGDHAIAKYGAGALHLTKNSTAASPWTVYAGTIGGTGSIGGALTLNNGATLDASAGVLTANSVSYGDNAAITVKVPADGNWVEGVEVLNTATALPENYTIMKEDATFKTVMLVAKAEDGIYAVEPTVADGAIEVENILSGNLTAIKEAAAAEKVQSITSIEGADETVDVNGLELFDGADLAVDGNTIIVDYDFGILGITVVHITEESETVPYVVVTSKVKNGADNAKYAADAVVNLYEVTKSNDTETLTKLKNVEPLDNITVEQAKAYGLPVNETTEDGITTYSIPAGVKYLKVPLEGLFSATTTSSETLSLKVKAEKTE